MSPIYLRNNNTRLRSSYLDGSREEKLHLNLEPTSVCIGKETVTRQRTILFRRGRTTILGIHPVTSIFKLELASYQASQQNLQLEPQPQLGPDHHQ